ncbi:MAG: bifunctional (p)ppGpp synthetase/guanosine-3',5'-bis(diphosphate) 3'-pyrophosphohydrolase [Ruminococcaceae bacterium]|nr:bifunctional (p)ppGpp synthetase/guanosine-3',5'-bis(diphosphate) 3'-pyrophosphohydrolase [Oscillospiraceae bacterium]
MEDILFLKLIEKMEKVNKKVNKEFIKKAFFFAKESHEGQFRVSGEPYYEHPVSVAMILVDLGMDDVTVASALLHDVLEDTEVTHEEMEKKFGKEVVELVEGVTKLGKIPYSSKEEQQIENLRKMFLAMAKDIRVIIIKLADRLHNLRTMKSMPDEKRREKALETMEIYAPLAHRLGIYSIKWEIEDISLMYLDPVAYKEISSQIAQKREERLVALDEIKQNIKEKIEELGIKATIDGRVKHFYSIYRKMYSKNITMDSIYDLFAIRVIVDQIPDCYSVLGVAHELYKPMPGRFKDYISMPKKNMYQSLHSTLISSNGTPFEIQIRTYDMHKTAEYGVAAHWKYKEGKESASDLDNKLTWVRQLLEIEKDNDNPKEFISNLKIDLFSDEVFVFTPKGDVVSLPSGSTAIDFAFAIHSQIGWKMVGAKVNGKIIQLETPLKNGDVVDIITSSHTMGPSNDWLKIAKTSQARNKINAWFKKENREENVGKGKDLLEKEFKKVNLDVSEFSNPELQGFVLKKFSFNHIDDFYATLGFGRISVEKVMNRVKDYYGKKNVEFDIENIVSKPQKSKNKNNSGIIVKGIDNCLIKFAKCCSPVPGDEIIGYITRGRGVSIHRCDCSSIFNIEKTDGDRSRLIEVSWAETNKGNYNAELLITANDRTGLLVDITLALNELKIPLRALNAKTTKNMLCLINITLEIDSYEKLSKAITRIKGIKEVIGVSRTNK